MMVNVLINVTASDLSAVWECFSINVINSLALLILGRTDLMLLAILIHINIRFSLFDLSKALWKDLSLAMLVSIISVGFST
jgi:hypothetical protein